jgi:hypothetical protein
MPKDIGAGSSGGGRGASGASKGMKGLASSLVGKSGSVSRVGGGVKQAASRVRPEVASDVRAMERRDIAEYRDAISKAARIGADVQKAMRDRRWSQRMTNEYEQAEIDAVRVGKRFDISPTETKRDIDSFVNLRSR